MRLWHQDLIKLLPRQQLLGQHRECCALRGNGWGKKHKTVDYVFNNSYLMLYNYHKLIMKEMSNRGYKNDPVWNEIDYRGKKCEKANQEFILKNNKEYKNKIYKEHETNYLVECLNNLKSKGIIINI